MTDIELVVYGNPRALKRHRTTKTGHNYDPSKADKETFLAMCLSRKPDTPARGRVMLRVECFFQRPKNHYNSKGILKDTAPSAHTSTPDYDNILKFISDALNGIFYADDSQIYAANIIKLYDETPRIQVKLTFF